MELRYDTEMKFARKLYKKACEGLEDTCPPEPDLWVQYAQQLREGWETQKLVLIGIIENDDNEEDKEQARAFLKCATAVYLDLMSSISVTFIESGEIDPFENQSEDSDDSSSSSTEDSDESSSSSTEDDEDKYDYVEDE